MPQSFTVRVQKFIEDVVNPSLSAHGGWVEVATADEVTGVIEMKMGGGCHGCAASALTMQHGIQSALKEEFPQISEIVDLTDHATGENPFFLGNPFGDSEGS
jgi:Fe/S biogenesis protein NfuA